MALRSVLYVLYTILVWLVAVYFVGLGWNATVPVGLALLAVVSCGLEFAAPLRRKDPGGGIVALGIGFCGSACTLAALCILASEYLAPIRIDSRIHYGTVNAVRVAVKADVLVMFAAVAVLGFLPILLERLIQRVERSGKFKP